MHHRSWTLNGININTIYAPLVTPTFAGTLTAPTINATTALQINGTSTATLYQPKSYVAARINGTGTSVATYTKLSMGSQAITNITYTNGTYTITWATAHPNGANYGVIITTSNNYYATYTTISSTSLVLNMYNSSGVATTNEYTFMTLP